MGEYDKQDKIQSGNQNHKDCRYKNPHLKITWERVIKENFLEK